MDVANKIVRDTFETIEGISKSVANDAKQSITGNYPSDTSNNPQVLPDKQKSAIKADDSQKAQVIRQNLAKITQQIIEARKKRENKVVQEERKQVQQKQEQKFESKKKESALMKLIKSNKGTKEGLPKASG